MITICDDDVDVFVVHINRSTPQYRSKGWQMNRTAPHRDMYSGPKRVHGATCFYT
jgi:hypothetical protein